MIWICSASACARKLRRDKSLALHGAVKCLVEILEGEACRAVLPVQRDLRFPGTLYLLLRLQEILADCPFDGPFQQAGF